MTGLPVSRIVQVDVQLSPPAAKFPNFSTCLILGTSDVIDVHERMRSFSGIDEVAAAFGTSAEEYLAALLWFEQRPQPNTILIGRWANAATHGLLVGGALTLANQDIAVWTAINDGAFNVTIDGVGPQNIGNLDFTAQVNFNGVAAVIESGFPGGTATCTWDATNERFTIASAATGATSVISFLSAPNAGTDISAMMAGLSTSSGAYQADGVAAESALDTVVIFDNQFSSQWYGLVIPSAVRADHSAIGSYIEADSIRHYYGVTTQESGVLVSGDTDNIPSDLKTLGLKRSAVQYSSQNAYAVVSYLSRILTTNWQANNSTITLMLKDEPGITAETLTTAQANAVQAKNCNVFVGYENDTAIIQYGQSSSGDYTDSVIGVDWLAATIQTNAYNVILQAPKVPQTDAGMHKIATSIANSCSQGINNGLGAPGVWTGPGFGQIETGDFLPSGFYIYQPPIRLQSTADRAARKSVPFQVAFKLGGAVHEVDIQLNVNP